VIVLGINNMHDASAALVIDGQPVAAAEEERFTRQKHQLGFPALAIEYTLREAGISIADVDVVAASWRPWVLSTRFAAALRALPSSLDAFRAKAQRGVGQMGREWRELFVLRSLIEKRLGAGRFKLQYVDHHLGHAASAFYPSPFERAAVLTVDGAGEADTTTFGVAEDARIRKLSSIKLPHSLGQFYAAITAFLGFRVQSDEYKVMGLAAYGEPVYADFLREKVLVSRPNGRFMLDPNFIDYHLARNGMFRDSTLAVLGRNRLPDEELTQRHMDVARSAQVAVEEIIFDLANHLHAQTGLPDLCLAGGVALNSVANGKLFEKTPFERIFAQPAAGDAGAALGAALHVHHSRVGGEGRYRMRNAYLGPSFSLEECKKVLAKAGLSFEELPEEVLCERTADALAEGRLVFWFQGRMEWGPRALGNRSLLADPRRADMQETINQKVKKRETFRPFAPSLLADRSGDYFGRSIDSPFMIFTLPVVAERRGQIPAVVHVDGTARPQTVTRSENPRYWRLIRCFEEKTGVPVLLNTSFNVQEPIVCTPTDAVSCFLGTDVEHLVLENLFVTRAGGEATTAGADPGSRRAPGS
jgi:carbamoyltransferase